MPFSKDDPNINRDGAPKKDWTWSSVLDKEAEKIDENDPDKKRKNKEAVAEAILKKAKDGDVPAFKEIANRTDGMPKQAIEHTGEIVNYNVDFNDPKKVDEYLDKRLK